VISKLSGLQRTILRMAYANRCRESDPRKMDVYHSEVFQAVYGWVRVDGWASRAIHGSDVRTLHDSETIGSQHFSKRRIGAARYRTAHAAVSRAFARLQARGVVSRYNGTASHWAGAKLTDLGIEVVRQLAKRKARTVRKKIADVVLADPDVQARASAALPSDADPPAQAGEEEVER